MATVVTLPINSTLPYYKFQCDLDGVTYGFVFRWNEHVGVNAWFFSILDASDNIILSELRLVVGFPLAARTRNASLPPGTLMAFDTSGQDLDPGLNDLGARVILLYFPAPGA